jgi:uncharacterized small protein (DUF1192 family)
VTSERYAPGTPGGGWIGESSNDSSPLVETDLPERRAVAITEESRHRLYERLDDVLGHEQATTLMEHLPPVGWADVATKTDLDNQSLLLKADLDNQSIILKGDLERTSAALKEDIAALKTDMDQRFVAGDHYLGESVLSLRSEMASQGGALQNDIERLRSEIQRDFRVHTLALMSYGVALTGIILSAVHFI